MTEFRAFPKIPRLNRGVVVTEKIDGTNACIIIEQEWVAPRGLSLNDAPVETWTVTAQSRNKIISPSADNYGFAQWVEDNRDTLIADLGAGYHYGEWWGQGIQRRYGLDHKRFSLFNTTRWKDSAWAFRTPNLHVVPVLYEGPFDTEFIKDEVLRLSRRGSVAAPGFMRPEGVIVYHTAGNHLYKVTCEGDDTPKSKVAQRRDL